MALGDMFHKETLDTILMKRFYRLFHSDAIMDTLVEKNGNQRWHKTPLSKWAAEPKRRR